MSTAEDSRQARSPELDPYPTDLISFWRSGTLSGSVTLAGPTKSGQCYDFIALLSVLQKLRIGILPITWQPALDAVGEGATAEIRQSLIHLQMSFAFKRFKRLEHSSSDNTSALRALISEVSILGQPPIRIHPNIVRLEGVCWDYSPEDEQVWPVLVFEKTTHGDLGKFLQSDAGRATDIRDRLKFCADVAVALMAMHSYFVHGDIKPENVLIFKDHADCDVAKIADFGYSTLVAGDDDIIRMPKSEPWNAPEHHHRGFTFSQALRMDAFSFGMLCLWLLFHDMENYPHLTQLKQLKSEDKLQSYAHKLIMAALGLEDGQRENLRVLFSSTLVKDPERRNPDFSSLLQLLTQDRILFTPKQNEDPVVQLELRPEITTLMLQLYRSDYTVRLHLTRCLKQRVDHDAKRGSGECAHRDAAFQVALCYKIGFGVAKDDQEALVWLRKSSREQAELQKEVTLIREGYLPPAFPDGTSARLLDQGYLDMMDFAQHYRQRQQLDRAELHYRREITDVESEMGDSHEIILLLNSILQDILYAGGRWDECEKLALKNAKAIEDICGLENLETLRSLTHLGLVYRRQGRWKEAEELQQKVADIGMKMHGPQHPFTLSAMGHLGSTYEVQGLWKKAKDVRLQVFERQKATLGPRHPTTLTTLSNIAAIYHANGEWEEAETLETQLMSISKEVLGEKHPDTLISMANLASTYLYQGQLKKAEELELLTRAIREQELGLQHPDTLNSMSNLSVVYEAQGREKEAEELGARVCKIRAEVFGEFHPDTLTSWSNLASIYRNQGKLQESQEIEVEVLEKAKTVCGPEHPHTLGYMNNLASTFQKNGQLEQAADIFEQALEIRMRSLGMEHPETLVSINNLASIYWDWNQLEKAEELFVVALEVNKHVLGQTHPQTLIALNNLAMTYQEQGKLKEAEEMGTQMVELSKAELGQAHPTTLTSTANLAAIWKLQGNDKAATELLKEVVQGATMTFGYDHPETAAYVQMLEKWIRELHESGDA